MPSGRVARAREPAAVPGRAGPGGPRDRRVDAAIRAAVMSLLAEAGYARLTMEKVAERAGVSKDSVYRRWPNKVALVAEALQHRARAVPEVPDTGSLPGDVRAFLRALLAVTARRHGRWLRSQREITTNAELRQAWHKGLAGMLTGCMRVIVTRARPGAESCPAEATLSYWRSCRCRCCRTGGWSRTRKPGEAVVERIVRQFYTPPGR